MRAYQEMLYGLHRKDDATKEKWRRLLGPEIAGKHQYGSGSNPSPATDGRHVVVFYKSGTVACFDLEGRRIKDLDQADAILDGMDDWNKSTHRKSGLVDRVRASTLSVAAAEEQMLAFLAGYIPAKTSPMCGNSICQDRRFLARGMPRLEAHFHYRNLDVSTLKELARRWRPDLARGVVKQGKHEALADIYESIEELKYYREHFLRSQAGGN